MSEQGNRTCPYRRGNHVVLSDMGTQHRQTACNFLSLNPFSFGATYTFSLRAVLETNLRIDVYALTKLAIDVCPLFSAVLQRLKVGNHKVNMLSDIAHFQRLASLLSIV